MKIFLTKFRISNFLDNRRPLPASTKALIAGSSELRGFAQRAAELDRALRLAPRPAPAEASLHESIMRAVRATAIERTPRRPARGLWLAPALGLAVLAVAMLWLTGSSPQKVAKPVAGAGEPALAVMSAALEVGGQISRTAPSEMIAPLSNEWVQVNGDVRGATRFVLSSLP